MKLFELPALLHGAVTREAYVCWLQCKAAAHVRRDRKRGTRERPFRSTSVLLTTRSARPKGGMPTPASAWTGTS
jgi:hypothetical protein